MKPRFNYSILRKGGPHARRKGRPVDDEDWYFEQEMARLEKNRRLYNWMDHPNCNDPDHEGCADCEGEDDDA